MLMDFFTPRERLDDSNPKRGYLSSSAIIELRSPPIVIRDLIIFLVVVTSFDCPSPLSVYG